ncbi:MAG: bifunctional 4-hydroxy-3-methylbut-2-enyl diphosphate reductase/30S ribosomal protein S1 [Oscillospiraceae bacterium]|nr:bifunctional 4-hydroxy-3-methylbut-2-enyl diphosphate reductase/30S ribosomal protein S1 [Oscillospiraceae bacterium]
MKTAVKIITAESAGFCFGVERAVGLCEAAARREGECFTLGPLIHNKRVTEALREQGITQAGEVSEIPENAAVVIRSHGVGRADHEALRAKNAKLIDATCPFVAKIHGIVAEAEREGRLPVIIGEREHAEVKAIAGWCGDCRVFETAEEMLCRMRGEAPDDDKKPLAVVFQTTSPREIFDSVSEALKKECTNYKIFDTICDATDRRQREAVELARVCDVFIVIGDRGSANSRRLAELAGAECPRVLFIEGADELNLRGFGPGDAAGYTVGITAGASTPARIIKEVTQKMFEETEVRTDEISAGAAGDTPVEAVTEEAVPEEAARQETAFEGGVYGVPAEASSEQSAPPEASVSDETVPEETAPEEPDSEAAAPDAAEQEQPPEQEPQPEEPQPTYEEMLLNSIRTFRTGDRVFGVIAAITPTEVTIDLGIKQSGYIPTSELLEDIFADADGAAKIDVEIGETVEAVVTRVNDEDGTVQLSRRRLAVVRTWIELEEAMRSGTIVEGKVSDANRGGVLVLVKGVRIFVPAARTGLPRGAAMTELLKKQARLIVTDVDRERGRVVGSIYAATKEERRLNKERIWNEMEPGKRYRGVVRAIKPYGAFVDIGGVDGMVHVSELSWSRISKPSDVLSVGDEVDVYIISADKETKRISLGYKDQAENPWLKLTERYQIGDVIEVKITGLAHFGAFAEILPGINGLIHISQLSDYRIENPKEAVSVGDRVNVKITGIDGERKRVSLSIRALPEDERKPQPDADEPQEAEEPQEAQELQEAQEPQAMQEPQETQESQEPEAAEAVSEAAEITAEPEAPEAPAEPEEAPAEPQEAPAEPQEAPAEPEKTPAESPDAEPPAEPEAGESVES